MALEITGNTFTLSNGLSFDSLYIRLSVDLNKEGDKIRISTNMYLNKTKYTENKRLSVPIKFTRELDYVRENDGTDILLLAHLTIKEDLITASVPEGKISIVDNI
jgi:hypothetical protein